MKTNRTSAMIALLLSASLLSLTSCQKDEMPTLSSDTNSGQSATARQRNLDSEKTNISIKYPAADLKNEKSNAAQATTDGYKAKAKSLDKGNLDKAADATSGNAYGTSGTDQPTLDQNSGGSKKMTETMGNMNPFNMGSTAAPTIDPVKNTQKNQDGTLKAEIKKD